MDTTAHPNTQYDSRKPAAISAHQNHHAHGAAATQPRTLVMAR
jgi:hypothetical protein